MTKEAPASFCMTENKRAGMQKGKTGAGRKRGAVFHPPRNPQGLRMAYSEGVFSSSAMRRWMASRDFCMKSASLLSASSSLPAGTGGAAQP